MPATGRQLYSPERLAAFTVSDLNQVISFSRLDAGIGRGQSVFEDLHDLEYDGMTREETVATALQSIADAKDELHGRALWHQQNHWCKQHGYFRYAVCQDCIN